MIQARVCSDTKLLVLYDIPQHKNWETTGRVCVDGLGKFISQAKEIGIDFADVSVTCLDRKSVV